MAKTDHANDGWLKYIKENLHSYLNKTLCKPHRNTQAFFANSEC
jgi:hypothetical protein